MLNIFASRLRFFISRNFKEKERFTDALQGRLHPENNPGFRENLKRNDKNEKENVSTI